MERLKSYLYPTASRVTRSWMGVPAVLERSVLASYGLFKAVISQFILWRSERDPLVGEGVGDLGGRVVCLWQLLDGFSGKLLENMIRIVLLFRHR